MEKANKNTNTPLYLGILISILCIAIIFWLIEPAEILTSLQSARYSYLLAATAGIVAFLALRAIRWRQLLDHDVPWLQAFHIQNIGYMLTMLMPFRLGDIARAVLIGNVPPVTFSRGVTTMVVERLFDLLFFAVLLPFTIANINHLPENVRTAAYISGIVGLIGIVILIIAANQRHTVTKITTAVLERLPFLDTERWLKQVEQGLNGLNKLTNWRDGLQLIFWSIMLWLPILTSYYIVMRSVNLQVTPIMAAFVTCVAAFSVAAPSSPGQIGVFHLAVTAALTEILGEPEHAAVSFAILYHTTQFLVFILMGLIGLFGAGTTFSNVLQMAQKRRNT